MALSQSAVSDLLEAFRAGEGPRWISVNAPLRWNSSLMGPLSHRQQSRRRDDRTIRLDVRAGRSSALGPVPPRVPRFCPPRLPLGGARVIA
jgi:hypothetical protein